MKKLIITEKPSVGQEFARVLNVRGVKDGYIENDEWIITWCIGHLVGMLYPESYDEKYKHWRVADLPFLPDNYKYGVLSTVKKQYNIVHKMLHRSDVSIIYWAGDSGREGQVIEENIRRFGGVGKNIKEVRVWIDSYTTEEILRGIAEAKPMIAYDNLSSAGVMRAIEDYAIGINFSRALTCKYAQLLNNAAKLNKYKPISIGRVMTCVLGMIVSREQEIKGFVETEFYKISGVFGENISAEWKADEGSKYNNSILLYSNSGFKEKKDAEQLIKNLDGKSAIVEKYMVTDTKKKAPLLFNLAELQSECSKKFKISPDETLAILQSLYEKKLTTYPRTDARVLSTAVANVIKENLNGLKNEYPEYINQIFDNGSYVNIVNTRYVDDTKITDHYAIIPTGMLTNMNKLNELEHKVFDLIVRRFLAIFYPDAVYKDVKVEIKIDSEKFFTGSKILVSPGYRALLLDDNDNKECNIPELKKGNIIAVKELSVKEGKTTPPKRYTSGTLILAMENAGNLIEEQELREQIKSCGIGTSATRAEILKKLIDIGYISCNKKSQILTPEIFGEMVYEVVKANIPEMLVPRLTAEWDKDLKLIEDGELSSDEYKNKLEVYVRDNLNKIIADDKRTVIIKKIEPFAVGKLNDAPQSMYLDNVKCPECGGKIKKSKYGYICEKYKKEGGCSFAVSDNICKKKIDEDDIKRLILKSKTNLIKGFQSKSGKKFDAYLIYKEHKVLFELPDKSSGILLQCPQCGKNLVESRFTLDCECGIKLWKVVAGKELSEDNIKELLSKGKTGLIKGFQSKRTGKKFDAYLKLNNDYTYLFEFPDKK